MSDKEQAIAESSKIVVQEAHSQRLTSLLLNGRNFLPWSRAIMIALGGRSRLGHITGRTKIPQESDPSFEEWQANDHKVMTWLFNSMESQIYEIFAYSDTAQALWESLDEMYGQANNSSRIFELQQGLAYSKQGANQSFTEHLGHMKKQWDELRQYRPATQNIADYIKREEQDKIFQLLASLKPKFEDTRKQILSSPVLPSFNSVCSTVQNEETRKRVMNLAPPPLTAMGENLAHNATITTSAAQKN